MSGSPKTPVAQITMLREHLGLSMNDCRRALDLAGTPDFGGDVLLAVGYVDRNQLAIHIKGDRHAAMLRRAGPFAEDLRARHPELSAAFPKPTAKP